MKFTCQIHLIFVYLRKRKEMDMLYVDSILVPVIILIALIWKGLEKLGKGIDSLGRKKMTDEEIIDFQRKCIERDLKWMEERKKRYNH